jgi:hypothetical protein
LRSEISNDMMYTMKRILSSKILSGFLIVGLIVLTSGTTFWKTANAASLTTLSDTQTELTALTLSSHDISYVTPTGLTTSQTITLTFSQSGGTAPYISTSFSTADVALSVNGAAQGVVVGSNTATVFGFARTSSTVITVTAPSSGTPAAASATIRIMIGTAAGGTNRIINSTAGTTLLAIVSGSDSGTIATPIIANDQVVVTATVNPTITFSLTAGGSGSGGAATNAVDFGTLSSSATRYATAGASSGGSATSFGVSALDLNVGTNATSGYTITFTAPTSLTDGSHPITAATLTGTNTGTPGATQFSMSGSATVGSPVVATAFRYNSTAASSNWNFVTATTTTLASGASATSGDTVSVRYLANIPSSQAAGNYTVTVTYIATGNF